MTTLSKVVWQEGMHLAQHHFQLQSRYVEDATAFAIAHLFSRPYGLSGYELDHAALLNGTVSVVHARGVMPDGMPFYVPDADPAPPVRNIGERFSPTQDAHVVYLAIPAYRPGEANCALDGAASSADVRYTARSSEMRDDTTGRDAKPVSVAQKNFRLLLDAELQDGLVGLPLARVRRDGAGSFIYDPEFIPPLLQVGASPALMGLMRRLLGILDAKSDGLVAQRRNARSATGEYASQEIASFWLAHSVNTGVAALRHHLEIQRSRPEDVFRELVRLGGALCTFALDSHPRQLPLYDHDQLSQCFAALEKHIRAHLDLLVPSNCINVLLERPYPLLRTATISDQRCFGPSQWIIGVRAEAKQGALAREVPQLIKVCSAKHIARLVKEGLPGLTVEHVAAPPSAIARRTDTQYFRIVRQGPCWDSIEDGNVAIFAPAALNDAEFELFIVLDATHTA
jgi:type VI secretion system protein ImpJ